MNIKKNLLFTAVVLCVNLSAFSQSAKSDPSKIYLRIPKKVEQTNYKNYKCALTTKMIVLTSSEEREVPGSEQDRPTLISDRNVERKWELANEYLSFYNKSMGSTRDYADLMIELIDNGIQLSDVHQNLPAAGDDEVIGKISGTTQLKVTDQNGKVLVDQTIAIPVEHEQVTKGRLLALNPGLGLQIKFAKKDAQKLLQRGLEDTRLLYLKNCMRRAGYVLKGLFEDQKFMFTVPVFSAKGKGDYAEIQKTAEEFKAMLKALPKEQSTSALKASSAFTVIQNSIAVWEKEAAQVSSAEGARINEEIAKGLNLNLASAYIFLGESDKAWKALARTGFVVAEGTELGGTGSAKEIYIDLLRAYYATSAAPDQALFN